MPTQPKKSPADPLCAAADSGKKTSVRQKTMPLTGAKLARTICAPSKFSTHPGTVSCPCPNRPPGHAFEDPVPAVASRSLALPTSIEIAAPTRSLQKLLRASVGLVFAQCRNQRMALDRGFTVLEESGVKLRVDAQRQLHQKSACIRTCTSLCAARSLTGQKRAQTRGKLLANALGIPTKLRDRTELGVFAFDKRAGCQQVDRVAGHVYRNNPVLRM